MISIMPILLLYCSYNDNYRLKKTSSSSSSSSSLYRQSIFLIFLSLNFLSFFFGGTLNRKGPSKNSHAAIKAPAAAIPKTWRIIFCSYSRFLAVIIKHRRKKEIVNSNFHLLDENQQLIHSFFFFLSFLPEPITELAVLILCSILSISANNIYSLPKDEQ